MARRVEAIPTTPMLFGSTPKMGCPEDGLSAIASRQSGRLSRSRRAIRRGLSRSRTATAWRRCAPGQTARMSIAAGGPGRGRHAMAENRWKRPRPTIKPGKDTPSSACSGADRTSIEPPVSLCSDISVRREMPNCAERTGRACLLLPASDEILEQATGLIDRALADKRPELAWARPYLPGRQGSGGVSPRQAGKRGLDHGWTGERCASGRTPPRLGHGSSSPGPGGGGAQDVRGGDSRERLEEIQRG